MLPLALLLGASCRGVAPPPPAPPDSQPMSCDPTRCPSGVCGIDGRTPYCKPPCEILYVDPVLCGQDADGSQKKPLCTIDAALAWTPSKSAVALAVGVHVAPSVLGRDLDIYGLGDATSTRLMGASGGATLSVVGLRLRLDHVTVVGRNQGISCSSGGSLLLSYSQVTGAQGVGVTSHGCDVTFRDAVLTENRDGAVVFADKTTYQVSCTAFLDNWSPQNAAVRISSDSIGGFRDSTVMGNQLAIMLPGGVYCIAVEKTLLNVGICGNTKDVDGGQVTNCAVQKNEAPDPCSGLARCP